MPAFFLLFPRKKLVESEYWLNQNVLYNGVIGNLTLKQSVREREREKKKLNVPYHWSSYSFAKKEKKNLMVKIHVNSAPKHKRQCHSTWYRKLFFVCFQTVKSVKYVSHWAPVVCYTDAGWCLQSHVVHCCLAPAVLKGLKLWEKNA